MTEKESKRAWRLAHPESVKASKRAHYLKYKELIRERQREYYAANRERVILQVKARYMEHRERILEDIRKRYNSNPGLFIARNRHARAERLDFYREREKTYQAAWRDRDPEAYQTRNQRGREKRRALKRDAFIEPINRRKVFESQNGRCGICGKAIRSDESWHLDHIIPLSKGGVHSYDNVQATHRHCNLRKSAKLPKGQLGIFAKLPDAMGGGR